MASFPYVVRFIIAVEAGHWGEMDKAVFLTNVMVKLQYNNYVNTHHTVHIIICTLHVCYMCMRTRT